MRDQGIRFVDRKLREPAVWAKHVPVIKNTVAGLPPCDIRSERNNFPGDIEARCPGGIHIGDQPLPSRDLRIHRVEATGGYLYQDITRARAWHRQLPDDEIVACRIKSQCIHRFCDSAFRRGQAQACCAPVRAAPVCEHPPTGSLVPPRFHE